MSPTPLVSEKTFAVCTNGLRKGEIVVGSQKTIKTHDNKLIATEFDKPTNFKCKYLGILIAIVGGFITAMFASGVGALIGGILIATVVAAAVTFGVGGAVCSFCLRSAEWTFVHPSIQIGGYYAITGKSQLICAPLFLPEGTITLYYSEDVANRVANITAINNLIEMFGMAELGAAIYDLGSAFRITYNLTLAVSHSITIATVFAVSTTAGLYMGGEIISRLISYVENEISDFFSGSDTKTDGVISEVDKVSNAPTDAVDPIDEKGVYSTTKSTQIKKYNIGSNPPS